MFVRKNHLFNIFHLIFSFEYLFVRKFKRNLSIWKSPINCIYLILCNIPPPPPPPRPNYKKWISNLFGSTNQRHKVSPYYNMYFMYVKPVIARHLSKLKSKIMLFLKFYEGGFFRASWLPLCFFVCLKHNRPENAQIVHNNQMMIWSLLCFCISLCFEKLFHILRILEC